MKQRAYPRFRAVSTAMAFLPEEERALKVLSVGTIGRGGIELLCNDCVSSGRLIHVFLYSKGPTGMLAADGIAGRVVSSVHWKDSLNWLNISFRDPISPKSSPVLYQYFLDIEKQLA